MLQDQDSRIEELLRKNESIFTGLKEKAQFINQTDQKLTHNLRNILTPLQNSSRHHYSQHQMTDRSDSNNNFNKQQTAQQQQQYSFYELVAPAPSNSTNNNYHQNREQLQYNPMAHDPQISFSNHEAAHYHLHFPQKPIHIQEKAQHNHHQQSSNNTQLHKLSLKPSQEQTRTYQNTEKQNFKIRAQQQHHLQHYRDDQVSKRSDFARPVVCCVFVPLNKLYRSPIMQLKAKDKLILARKYKGATISSTNGKISDGKIYKFSNIISEEEELYSFLSPSSNVSHTAPFQQSSDNSLQKSHRQQEESNILAIIGARDTLKKKLHMCLLIRQFQLLTQKIEATRLAKIDIQYSEIWDKAVKLEEQETLSISEETKKLELERLNMIFDRIFQLINTNKKSPVPSKGCTTKSEGSNAVLPKHLTRITRIIYASDNQRRLLEVISSNNENINFVAELAPDKVVWCMNPLVKNYQDTQQSLENATQFEKLMGV